MAISKVEQTKIKALERVVMEWLTAQNVVIMRPDKKDLNVCNPRP